MTFVLEFMNFRRRNGRFIHSLFSSTPLEQQPFKINEIAVVKIIFDEIYVDEMSVYEMVVDKIGVYEMTVMKWLSMKCL